MLKRWLVILATGLAAVMILVSSAAHAGRVIEPDTEALGLLFTENMELTSMTSALYGRSDQSTTWAWKLCRSTEDPICVAANEVSILQFFDFCPSEQSVNCIARVWATSGDGRSVDGAYQRHLPASGTGDFPADPRIKLPASKGAGFVVRLPGVIHAGGTDEYLVALRNQPTILKKSGESLASYDYPVQGLVGGISPFKILNGNYKPTVVVDGYGSEGDGIEPPAGEACIAKDLGICAAARDFPTGFRFGMSVRLSQQLRGWFHGRIATPEISIRTTPDFFEVSIEANPVQVAALDFTVPASTLSQEIRDLIFNGEEWGMSKDFRGTRIVTGLEEERAQTLLRLFTPSFNDRATRTNQFWTFKTLGNFREDSIQRCTKDSGSLAGVVTTNALLYSAGPPEFNTSESSLDYKVAAPHFESDGDEASGTYDLLLRSDIARCIYGFSQAPIKASLEVISDDGDAKIVTTSINERNGWLSMSASGFGFSSPIVRARLTQDKPEPVVTPSPSPTASSAASPTPQATTTVIKTAKKAITCVKGEKKKKRVQATKSKCPSGWKKA